MKKQQAAGASARLRERVVARINARQRRILDEGGAIQQRLLHDLEVHQIELEMQNEELKLSRHEVELERRRYADLFEFAPTGYLVLAADQTIEEANHAAARLLGVARAHLVGRRFSEYLLGPARAGFDVFCAGVLTADPEDRRNMSCDLILLTGGNRKCDVRVTAVLRDGLRPSVLLSVEDVSLRKRAERVLHDESQRKDDFLAMLSHELRNPLAPIRTSLFLLARGGLDAEAAKRPLAVMGRQIGHLTRLVDDLVDVTRIARGKILLQRKVLDLGELVRGTLDDYRPTFESLGVELAASFAPESPWVDADPERLVQVLGNLLGNAAKFTSRGGRVDVALMREAQDAVLSVRDTGEGMSPETLAHVFEAFVQGPQALDRARGGLGLGLAMVKGFVELHGGSVEAESPGLAHGSTFWLRLESVEPARPEATPALPNPSAAPRRILVIEDNVDAAEMLQEALALDGHEVRIAHDGSTGLALARDFRPEAVLCDIGLPQMNGYEVAHAIRRDAALEGAYLIALTGYAQPEDRKRATDAGFNRHLAKPVDVEKLKKLLEESHSASWHGAAGRHS